MGALELSKERGVGSWHVFWGVLVGWGRRLARGGDWEFRVWHREGDTYLGVGNALCEFMLCHHHGDGLRCGSWGARVDERPELEPIKDASGRHSHEKTCNGGSSCRKLQGAPHPRSVQQRLGGLCWVCYRGDLGTS